MNDRPTAPELLDAVERFLRQDVIPATDGTLKFQARVAANVVAMVSREFERGEAPLREEWARVSELLGESDPAPLAREELEAGLSQKANELSERIRRGDADEGPFREAVVSHLKETVAEKRRVAKG